MELRIRKEAIVIDENKQTHIQESTETQDEKLTNEELVKKYKAFALRAVKELQKIATTIKGYSQSDIRNIVNNPENYQIQLIDLSHFMYRRSGLFRRVIDYFVDNVMYLPNIDTEVINDKFYKVKPDMLKRNWINFAGAISKLNLEKEMRDIFIRVFLEDAYFGYILETPEGECFLYPLPSSWCSVRKTYNGVLIYGINAQAVSQQDREKLPEEIQRLLNQSTTAQDAYVYPEPDRCFCIKYNSQFTYLYPPLFDLLRDVVDIDDYRELAKAKTESDNYNLLALEIPTGDDKLDDLMFTDDVIWPTYNMARNVLPSSFGVIASALPVKEIQWRSNATAEKNKVQDAIDNFYDCAGIPKALMGSGTSGSIVTMAILNDATVLFKLYRQIEKIVNLRMTVSGYVYPSYKLVFKMLDITYLTQKDAIEKELKLANASVPNKARLAASTGMSPAKMLGNDHMENTVLEIGLNWTPLKSSYTQSSNTGGRPSNESIGETVTEITETGIDNEGNNPDNRI